MNTILPQQGKRIGIGKIKIIPQEWSQEGQSKVEKLLGIFNLVQKEMASRKRREKEAMKKIG